MVDGVGDRTRATGVGAHREALKAVRDAQRELVQELRSPEGRATLFVPKLGLDYEVFCGHYPSADDFRARYAVDETSSTLFSKSHTSLARSTSSMRCGIVYRRNFAQLWLGR